MCHLSNPTPSSTTTFSMPCPSCPESATQGSAPGPATCPQCGVVAYCFEEPTGTWWPDFQHDDLPEGAT